MSTPKTRLTALEVDEDMTVGGGLSVSGDVVIPKHEKWVVLGSAAYNTEGVDSGVTLYTLPAGSVLTGVACKVTTAFAGGTPVVVLGTAATADALLASADVTEGTAGTYYKAAALVGAAGGTAIKASFTNVGTGTAGAATFYGRIISI